MKKRILSIILALCLCAVLLPTVTLATQSMSGNFRSNYTLTGDLTVDIAAVALAQNGRTQSELGYTEGWCADFVSDCAKIVGQSEAIPFYGGVSGLYNYIVAAGGYEVSTPQQGDIVFYNWDHVGIMSDSLYCISGNMWSSGYSKVENIKYTSINAGSIIRIVRPNYRTSPSPYTVSPTPTYSYTYIQPGTYYLKNASLSKYLAVDGGSGASTANVSVQSFDGSSAQKMEVISAASGYKFRPLCSAGPVVNPYAWTISSGVNVNIYDDLGNDSTQWWTFEAVSGGYIIHNLGNESCVLDCETNGNVVVATRHGGSSQIWTLEAVTSTTPATPSTALTPVITTDSLENGTVGKSYLEVLDCTNGLNDGISEDWTCYSGSLPDGLYLTDYGSIKGVPTKAGTYTFRLRVTTEYGSDRKQFTITIREAATPAPKIQTASTETATVGVDYMQRFTADVGDVEWKITSGTVPSGLMLGGTGEYASLSGTPAQAGTYTFTLQASNQNGSDSRTYTVTVINAVPKIETESLGNMVVGEYYVSSFKANVRFLKWAVESGELPDGLSIQDTYFLCGTPTKAGTYTFTIKAYNDAGSDMKTFTVTVAANPKAPVITMKAIADTAEVNKPYSQPLTASGEEPITWSVASGSLPDGLTLYDDGTISGTPAAAGTFRFTVAASNDAGSAEQEYVITVSGEKTCTLSFETNGGSELPDVTCKPNDIFPVSDFTVTRAGYDFTGWYADAALTYRIAAYLQVSENMTIYAGWEKTEIPEVHFEKQTIYFQGQYSDIPANQQYTDSVKVAVELGLMKGNDNGTFNPFGNVTIAETITMSARIHSIYYTGRENFGIGNPWWQPYLEYAYSNGIISYAFYNCDVTQTATRAQFAEILSGALPDEALYPMNSVADNAIPDVKLNVDYAPCVYRLYRAGILIGSDANGTFYPDTYILRKDAAAIVSRMAKSNSRVGITLD